MGIAVEDGEGAGQHHGRGQGQAAARESGQSQHADRQKNAGLDERQAEASQTPGAAGDHHGDEAGGYQPDAATADIGRKQTDGEHGDQMIVAAEGMGEAMDEARGHVMPRMGLGGSGHDGEDNRCGGDPACHVLLLCSCNAPPGHIL